MEENETVQVVLDLDLETAEKSLQAFMEGMESLQDLARNIGTELRKAFAPLQATLQKTVTGVDSVTDALSEATTAMQNLMDQMANEQIADQWLGGISTATEGLSLFAIVIGPMKKAIGSIEGAIGEYIEAVKFAAPETGVLTAMFPKLGAAIAGVASWFKSVGGTILGILGTIGVKAAVIVAVVSAVIAGIVAIVKNWDQISSAMSVFFTETLPQLWNQFTQWITGIGTVLAEMISNIMPIITGFLSECWNGIVAVFSGIGSWIQTNIITPVMDLFTPVVSWFSELFGSIFQTVSDVFYNIGVIICGCWEIIKAAWGVVSAWFNDTVILPICNFFTGLWTTVSTAAVAAWNAIKETLVFIGSWIYSNVVVPVSNFLAGMWSGFLDSARAAWEGVKSVFGKVAQFFRDVFSAAWEGVVKVFSVAGAIFTNIKDGILTAFKAIVNGIITGINSIVKIPFDGINSAIQTIRNIRIFEISPFTNLKSINVPQIPYLAKGAVLPANRPFLAVVGDQRHGTNIEAPLSTIQEAMALTMEDFVASNMAGHEATIGVLREILEAVLGIHIGDADIAQAAQRYARKMAVVHGRAY